MKTSIDRNQKLLFKLVCSLSPLLTLIFLTSGSSCASGQSVTDRDVTRIQKPTFNADVAPIIHAKCSACHRPGQAGPFSLLTYQDVVKRASTIEAVTDSGYMPPWKPVGHDFDFANDRSLSDDQKSVLRQWINSGRLKGTGPEPSPPVFADEWLLGKPDHIVKMIGRYSVPASGPDIYRSFVFPLQFEDDRWIKAIEYRPTAKSSVHHALFFVDRRGAARMLDGQDGQPGISGMSFLSGDVLDLSDNRLNGGVQDLLNRVRRARSGEVPPGLQELAGGLGGYVPGSTPTKLPGDLALHLPAGSDIVMQTHFHPSGKSELEEGELAIYFADKEPSKRLVNLQIPAAFGFGVGLKIPAGEKAYKVSESFELPTDIRLISVGAHAHYICRQATMTAKLPDGSSKVVLNIDDWDLDWQDRYYFKNHVFLPAGTVLTSELLYDNSADNPENPNSPPREIRWGRESGDEMGSLSVQAVAVDEAARPNLELSIGQYMLKSVMQGDIVDSLLQLDTNRDGGLQASEAPPRMQQRFPLLDRNHDEKLDREELEVLRRFLPANGR